MPISENENTVLTRSGLLPLRAVRGLDRMNRMNRMNCQTGGDHRIVMDFSPWEPFFYPVNPVYPVKIQFPNWIVPAKRQTLSVPENERAADLKKMKTAKTMVWPLWPFDKLNCVGTQRSVPRVQKSGCGRGVKRRFRFGVRRSPQAAVCAFASAGSRRSKSRSLPPHARGMSIKRSWAIPTEFRGLALQLNP